MATPDERITKEQRIRAEIEKIGNKPRSVRFDEIEWVMNRLMTDLGYRVRRTGQLPHYTYTVEDVPPFQVAVPHAAGAPVLVCYVKGFLNRMSELGLWGSES